MNSAADIALKSGASNQGHSGLRALTDEAKAKGSGWIARNAAVLESQASQ